MFLLWKLCISRPVKQQLKIVVGRGMTCNVEGISVLIMGLLDVTRTITNT